MNATEPFLPHAIHCRLKKNVTAHSAGSQLHPSFSPNKQKKRQDSTSTRVIRRKFSPPTQHQDTYIQWAFFTIQISCLNCRFTRNFRHPKSIHTFLGHHRSSRNFSILRTSLYEGLLYINIANYADSRNWSSDLASSLATIRCKRLKISKKKSTV